MKPEEGPSGASNAITENLAYSEGKPRRRGEGDGKVWGRMIEGGLIKTVSRNKKKKKRLRGRRSEAAIRQLIENRVIAIKMKKRRRENTRRGINKGKRKKRHVGQFPTSEVSLKGEQCSEG